MLHEAENTRLSVDDPTSVTAHSIRNTLDAVSGAAAGWLGARERLAGRSARRWYLGSIWGLVYLAVPIVLVWVDDNQDPLRAAVTTVLVVAIGVAYVITPPLITGRAPLVAVIAFVGFTALTCLAFPLIGLNAMWFWIYLPVMAAFSWQPRVLSITVLAVVVVGQVVLATVARQMGDYWYAVALTASVGTMMIASGAQIETIIQLRAAQAEIQRLAVVEERSRFARDMHDVLGHSLTVVAVKSELAGKLVRRDPARAEDEIADVERLARSALVDLRAAVAGYRSMDLSAELAAAAVALAAADITAHLPITTDTVDVSLQETFAWVLRESITNVIRHSGARNCWVRLDHARITIADDGRGGAAIGTNPAAAGGGTGLAGLAQRAIEAGAHLTIVPRDTGGTLITAERAHP